jgi:hypothetical protein
LPRTTRGQYIRRRVWPKLRIFTGRLFRSLFRFRSQRSAARHFNSARRRTLRAGTYVSALARLGTRLDVLCLLLKIAPTVFWARRAACYGLFRVNGQVVRDPVYCFRPRDVIQPVWSEIYRFSLYFKSLARTRPRGRIRETVFTRARLPTNLYPRLALNMLVYQSLPQASTFSPRSRLHSRYVNWYRLGVASGIY